MSQALQDVAGWIDDVRRTAGQTADRVTAEARARSAEGTHLRRNEDRLAAALMDSLAQRALQLKSDADELARLLERAAAQLGNAASDDERARRPTSPQPQPQPKSESKPKPKPKPEPEPQPQPLANPLARKRDVSEGIRLLTMQMAVAGSTRKEIEHRLRKEFKVDHAEQVLDEVLKPT